MKTAKRKRARGMQICVRRKVDSKGELCHQFVRYHPDGRRDTPPGRFAVAGSRGTFLLFNVFSAVVNGIPTFFGSGELRILSAFCCGEAEERKAARLGAEGVRRMTKEVLFLGGPMDEVCRMIGVISDECPPAQLRFPVLDEQTPEFRQVVYELERALVGR